METINGLLRQLDNKVPASFVKRLDGLQKLNQKLANARAEHEANPTEVSQESLDEIVQFIEDTQDDLAEDLSELVEKKRIIQAKEQEVEKRAEEQEAKKRAEEREQARKQAQAREQEARKREEARASREKQEIAEREERERQEAEKKAEEEALNPNGKTEAEKKSGIGWGSLLLGGVLLVATGGAIKYFGNRK
jgi:septal ring factor EnvC (AmiA/AmiB activator)